MRVLFVNSASDRAGGSASAATLAAALAHAGVEVTIACGTRGDLRRRLLPRQDVAVHEVRFGPDFDPLAAATLARIARRSRADVVLADRRKDVKLLVLARAFGLRAPIVHRHGAPSTLRDGPVYRFAWQRIAAMVANSHAMRAALLRATPWLDAVPLHVVHNGVDSSRFRPLPERGPAMRADLGIASDAFVVAYVGTLQPRKRVALLVRAAVAVPGAARPHLLVVGDGPERDALADLARAQDVAATFTGYRTDLPDLLAAADVAAHLSSAEGFSNSVLECLACGLPVIATDEHSHAEQVDHEITGLLVRPDAADVAAALQRLRDDTATRAVLARTARETAVERFDVRSMARGYVDVLSSVLGR